LICFVIDRARFSEKVRRKADSLAAGIRSGADLRRRSAPINQKANDGLKQGGVACATPYRRSSCSWMVVPR